MTEVPSSDSSKRCSQYSAMMPITTRIESASEPAGVSSAATEARPTVAQHVPDAEPHADRRGQPDTTRHDELNRPDEDPPRQRQQDEAGGRGAAEAENGQSGRPRVSDDGAVWRPPRFHV